MRRVVTSALGALLVAGLAGCGDRSLVLTVDILSFLDPGSTSMAYGPIPAGLPATPVEVANQEVNLLQGIEDVTEVSNASLRVAASFDNATGDATGMLYVHVAPAEALSPFDVAPIASIPVTVAAGQVTNVEAEVASSTTLAAALTSERAKVGLRITFDTSASSAVLTGTENLTVLRATVVTKKKL